MIKALLWDIDNTLLDFHRAEEASIRKCFADIGKTDVDEAFLKRYSVLNRSYWDMLERGEITTERLCVERFEVFCKNEGIALKDAAAFNLAYQQGLGENVFPIENSIELIKELKKSYLQFAVTNGSAVAQHAKLKNSGLDLLFDGVFISEEVGADKPSKEFFDIVFEKTGLLPENTVLIGDSLTSDIAGANAAGIRSIWFNPAGKEGTGFSAKVRSLWEIPGALKEFTRC